MTNPNIVNVTEIYGNTAVQLATTGAVNLVVNANGSGKIYKINSLYVSNYDGTNAADITLTHFLSNTGNGTLVSTVSVAADSTLVVLTKDSSIYLMEYGEIRVSSNSTTALNLFCSWDEIK